MDHSAIEAFSAHAHAYDGRRQMLIPGFDAFYSTAAQLVGLRGTEVRRVLDLGAGTGLLSERIARVHPEAELVLLDGSREMLGVALTRLGRGAIEIHRQDLREQLPAGPFDAIVSALAIHHLEDQDKQDLLARVHSRLRPGGVFVNAEQVAVAAAWIDRALHVDWRAQCLELGASEQELANAEERMSFDHCVAVQTQIAWMHAVGLRESDCFFRRSIFAVIAGWRGEE
ncbi:MAG TPA: class I SAM-dependent methyltransferase [Solirubrobacteraceae bacterium]|jgi:tRNA (cmo5U34)-methyltransferase